MIHCSTTFVEAILNEKMLYDFFCEENGCIAILHHPLPLKVFRSADYAKRHRVFFITALFLLDHVFFWALRLFFLKNFLVYSLKKLSSGSRTEPISGKVLLYYLSLLPVVVQKTDLKDEIPECTVLKRFGTTPDYPGAKHQLTLVQAASYGDLFRSCISACREISLTRKAYGAQATLHAMKAYDMHLTRIVLEKNLGITQIVYANMVDRWACLFSHMEGTKRVLLQHGIIGRVPSGVPSGILGSVDVLYLISENYLPYYRHGMKNIGSVRIIPSDFTPVPCEKRQGTISVLLVANSSVNFQKEKMILELMLRQPDKLDVYLKPHPRLSLSPYYELREQYDFRLIEDKTFFPAADAIVSYVSTLAWEYESRNTPVFYYDQMSVEEIMNGLENLYAKEKQS